MKVFLTRLALPVFIAELLIDNLALPRDNDDDNSVSHVIP